MKSLFLAAPLKFFLSATPVARNLVKSLSHKERVSSQLREHWTLDWRRMQKMGNWVVFPYELT